MTFGEWYDFNTQKNINGHKFLNIGSVYIKITTNCSLKKEDIILTSLMSLENVNLIFSEYQIILISLDLIENSKHLSFLLSKY